MGKVRMGSVRLTAFATLVTGCADAPPPPSDAQIAYAEIVAEEDARGEIGLERVLAHVENDDPWVRAMAVRALGRLEDRSGVSLEEIALSSGLPARLGRQWRIGRPPSEDELRAILEFACAVSGGVAVLLLDGSQPWPVRE